MVKLSPDHFTLLHEIEAQTMASRTDLTFLLDDLAERDLISYDLAKHHWYLAPDGIEVLERMRDGERAIQFLTALTDYSSWISDIEYPYIRGCRHCRAPADGKGNCAHKKGCIVIQAMELLTH